MLAFNRYSQFFYLSMFSALENIGQILNVMYDLQTDERVSFDAVIKKSKKKEFSNLPNRILDLRNSDAFNSFIKIRNDITHNFLPGLLGGSVTHELDEKIAQRL